jgi:hypothetical protein
MYKILNLCYLDIIIIMSQNPNKRNKDIKEVVDENVEEKPVENEDRPIGEPVEEVAGQRDTKSADAADSADSMIV